MVMSFSGDEKQWKCGKGGAVNLQRVSSIVRDIGEPCLHQPQIKVMIAISKMLKPDKWQAAFDGDGKILGFQKVLKSIVLGGVDPSIRAEVWEFLLGCYTLSSTTEYRRKLRTARRERYQDLVRQCQMMHSSVGTGSLAYVIGSKVMDMRASSKDEGRRDAEVQIGRISEASASKKDSNGFLDGSSRDKSYSNCKESSSDSGDLVSMRGSTTGGSYDSSGLLPSHDPCNCSPQCVYKTPGSKYADESYLDFPALPVTNLFEKNKKGRKGPRLCEENCSSRHTLTYEDEHMHSFQISNNADLVVEADVFPASDVSLFSGAKKGSSHLDFHESLSRSNNSEYEQEMLDSLRISDAPETPITNGTTSQALETSEGRVSEWLWTLHRIVVDVVRTDNHLEFYEDTKNLARMSDILAVCAWVDPETGYCQGMSDLLSPFVVLFEDNADAFWCFEMLLRRMRDNFKMEGPTGVMKQLQVLWHVLELTDKEIFSHLAEIGAESLHFAFRMLLVLFRRELSFTEALCMWEMIWAADFDPFFTCHLDENCPELLSIQLPKDVEPELGEESVDSNGGVPRSSPIKHGVACSIADSTGMRSTSARPFCGLTKPFWSKNDRLHMHTILSSARNGDELPVFCVAAILIMNRQKIVRETCSIDDLIKIFNDNILKIRVKSCIRTAIKLRKKYLYKVNFQI
ncbi:small G protein signaling modulator 1-like [Dorcoceras hygrometricum]|uniref:Small G protein signaling modulator 1-like n=1 Tax=Dorcoceras hygrometricum TaxID=472368 RepID=A0A2Z7CQ00_9LAMI|nr:small G protein signaling modulator 1-like [Dorcoceras hygrometricum]